MSLETDLLKLKGDWPAQKALILSYPFVRHEEVPYSVRRNWQNGWDGYAFEVDQSHTWAAVSLAERGGAFTREQYYEVFEEYRQQKLAKGEAEGHKFRGNQHTGGIGGMGGPKKRPSVRDRLRERGRGGRRRTMRRR